MPPVLIFSTAAVALLGSPGPGIAALVSVGQARGFRGAFPFYAGMQLGLAIASAGAAALLASAQTIAPSVMLLLSLGSALYLAYLAYAIATAPIAPSDGEAGATGHASAWSGVLLGLVNPKALLAFIALMAGPAVVPGGGVQDLVAKWLICVAVMLVVDAAWLALGDVLNRTRMPPAAVRALNIAMGAAVAAVAIAGLVELVRS